jgi:23S rRNA pseudouridine2605 synthase
LNAEQLNSARLARWSQNGEARLTLEAATEWLGTIGFCPYLPFGAAGASPMASFLEAVVGRPAQTPSAGERSRANELLVRMVENSAGVPLKLGNSLGEQPDFVSSPEALRYIYALGGDRNFKAGPSTVGNDKVTPLALHCWEAIQEHGPLDVPALQPILGRDITEAAIARALQELWVGLYVFPVASVIGKPAKWELLSRHFPGQVAAGASTGQAEAQSAMVSLYLYAVVAAAEEEVLAFLSPLAPQSKLREVIRGLGSMRQLDIIDIGGRAHVCLQGGLLPEMVAQLSEEQLGVSSEETQSDTAGIFEGGIEIEREPQRAPGDTGEAGRFVPKKFVPKKFMPRASGSGEFAGKPFRPRTSSERPSFGGAARASSPRSAGTYASRPQSFAASGGDVPGYMGKGSKGSGYKENSDKRRGSDRPVSGDRKPSTRGLGERAKRWEKSGEGAGERPFAARTGHKPSADRKPPFKSSGFKSSGFKPGGFKSAGSGAPKRWASKAPRSSDAGAKPWMKRASLTPGAPRERDSEEHPKRWEKPGEGAGASASGYKKPYAAKSSGSKPGGFKSGGFKPGGSKPWASRTGSPSSGAPKRWEKSGPGAGERPQPGARAAGTKSWGAKPGGRKPSGFTASGFKSAGTRSAEGRAGESKPWVSRGAESRVGSAKSYAARKSRTSEGEAQRGPRKPYGKTEGTKPWTKRSTSERPDTGRSAGEQPTRGERPAAGAQAGEKRAAKPFWAKNPRGGKGSVAASRTNRPRGGKKAGGKKNGKKK